MDTLIALGICHEIRNPIQGIVGNCDIMMDTIIHTEKLLGKQNMAVSLIESMRACTEAIQVCAKYQKTITDDVLTLSVCFPKILSH